MSSASRGLAPREGLERLLVKMGHTGPRMEPHHGPQSGKSGDPRSQNTDRANNDQFERRQLVQLILTKVVFACKRLWW